MSEAVIAPFSRRQHGLVTHAQALEVLSIHELKERLRERRLEPLRRGVYRVAGAPESWHQHLLAACLAAGDGAAASFRAATFLWGLNGFSSEVLEVTVPGRRRTRLDGVVVHDSRVTGPLHVATRSFIPVTSAARTLCDMTTWLPRGRLPTPSTNRCDES
jgi:predicted transcriptional regulator of viral defense system